MISIRYSFVALALAIALGVPALAGVVDADADGLAIKGYDPVAYFTDSKAVKGDAQYSATHDGATYRFASAANRDAFVKEPGKYAPQLGGYCAYGVAKGAKFDTDPNAFAVHEGKLYLNLNPEISQKFQADLVQLIKDAVQNWPKVQNQPVATP